MELLKLSGRTIIIIMLSVIIVLRVCAIVVFYYRPYQKTKTPPSQKSVASKPPSTVSTAAPSSIQSGTQCTAPAKYNYDTNLCATCNGTWSSAVDAVTNKPITLCLNASQQNEQVTFTPSTTPSGSNCADPSDFFVSNYDGYPNVCVKCLKGTALDTNTNKCVLYDANGNFQNADDTNLIKSYYSASPSTIIIPTSNTDSKSVSKLSEVPSVLNSVFFFGILNTCLFLLPLGIQSNYVLIILLTFCLIELVLNVNLYYICSSDKHNSTFKNDEYSMTYNIGTNVLSIVCIIALYLMNDDNDEKKGTRTTEYDEDVEDDENIHHLRDPLFKKQVEVLATQKELEERRAQLHDNIDNMKQLEHLRQRNVEIAAEQELQRKNRHSTRPFTPESTEFTPRRTNDVTTRYTDGRRRPIISEPEIRPRRSRL